MKQTKNTRELRNKQTNKQINNKQTLKNPKKKANNRMNEHSKKDKRIRP